MKRPMLILGVVLVIIGGLFIARDYGSRPACTCATLLPIPNVEVGVMNVSNGGEVNGYILAFGASMDSSGVTVTDLETGRTVYYRKEGELYVPADPPLPFRRFRVNGLGNVTVEVHWQNPLTTVVLDTPEFKPVPGGFEYVQTFEYPSGPAPTWRYTTRGESLGYPRTERPRSS
ncbi:hypothetical protein [Thermococcus aciditolerans]|uniref:Uncharacterized protein n=1 Tax=Thermococcus aciditolerans TaxID=2598455 RepID=A0A5C0SML3_9EURY|nr:hypothetical protein [Thermococcus aciditolerans]QEK15641.1 hypothetical protein FPV09_11745 [Thermococcus aciditolerans]